MGRKEDLLGSLHVGLPSFGGTTAKSKTRDTLWAEFTTSSFGGFVGEQTSRTSFQISKFRWKKCTAFAWICSSFVMNQICGSPWAQRSLLRSVGCAVSTAPTSWSTGPTLSSSRLRLSKVCRRPLLSKLFHSGSESSSRSIGRQPSSKSVLHSVNPRQAV